MAGAGERDLEEALKQCDADIERQPDSAAAHYQRATVLQSLQRLDEALQSYDRAIALDPGLADAHNQRANLLGTLQRFDEAVAGYDRAVRAKTDFPAAWTNRARALRALRRLEDALRSCDMAVRLQPDNHEPHLVRGNVLMELGRPDVAIQSYERAIAIKADLAEAHYNRANAVAGLGRLQDALRSYDRAIAIRPEFAAAHHGRANTLAKLGRSREAVEGFDRAIALKPDLAEAYNNKGNILSRLGRYAEAAESYSLAVRARPAYALGWNNLGRALEDLGRVEEALKCCDKAIELAPALVAAHYNRGNILKGAKHLAESIQSFDRAIELAPNFAPAHRNKMTTTLLMGDFDEGWRLYERRNAGMSVPPQAVAIWTGEERLEGKTLLIAAEQGLGDTIQFCRYARLAAARGARVTLAVQDALVSLLKCLEPEISVTGVNAVASGFDYYIPLLSMPQAFRTRSDNIPSSVPYIRADADRVRQWKARLGTNGFKIGICWQGAPGGEVDVGRSFPVKLFEPLGAAPGVRLISLQKNAGAEQLRDLPAGMKVESFGDTLDQGPDAFVDTAAIMENLDLVITSDTAIAHLSGALGRSVWVALNHVPDWRWLLDRSDSPWYPTMRLFRQTARGDWPGVFDAMKTCLLELLAADGEPGGGASQ
jgi:tetratricopeptide (TPR) repeat protein